MNPLFALALIQLLVTALLVTLWLTVFARKGRESGLWPWDNSPTPPEPEFTPYRLP